MLSANNSKYLIVLFLLFSFCRADAQLQGQARLDSLLREIPAAKEDTLKVTLMQLTSYEYRSSDPQEGLKYGLAGLALAEKLKWEKGVAASNNAIAINYKALSNYPKALSHFQKALRVYETIGDRQKAITLLMNVGTVYRPLKEFAKAEEYYRRALEMNTAQAKLLTNEKDVNSNKRVSGQLYGNLGVVYFEQERFKEATANNLKALRIFEEINDLGNISWVLANLGDAFESEKKFDEALKYQDRALQINTELNNKSYLASTLENIGRIHFNMAEDAKAKSTQKAELSLSISYYNKALAIVRELEDLDYISSVLLNISRAYELSGNYKEAIASYKEYTMLKDSVHSIGVKESIAELETQRAVEIKDREVEIARLKKRNEAVFLISAIVLISLLAVFMLFGYYKQKQANKLLGKEKQKSEDLLLNILPVEVADELKEKGFASARHFNEVTVLFTDFVNFTSIAEAMSPQALVDELHACFKAFDNITSKYRIEKIKTVGDAYLAVSGLPLADEQHAHNVIRAAIEIVRFVQERKKAIGVNAFDIRVGVNSGSVVAGIVGVKKFAYDIWGDTVNIASRMEQGSSEGKINISEATYILVKDQFKCTYRGELEVKNKGKMPMYFVEVEGGGSVNLT